MTKDELIQINLVVQIYKNGLGPDYLARGLSAIHRAARGQNTKNLIEKLAVEHGVRRHAEFLIDHQGLKAYHAARA